MLLHSSSPGVFAQTLPSMLLFQNEVSSAVLGPGCFIVSRIEGPFLAVADSFDASRSDSLGYEEFLGRVRAPVT